MPPFLAKHTFSIDIIQVHKPGPHQDSWIGKRKGKRKCYATEEDETGAWQRKVKQGMERGKGDKKWTGEEDVIWDWEIVSGLGCTFSS